MLKKLMAVAVVCAVGAHVTAGEKDNAPQKPATKKTDVKTAADLAMKQFEESMAEVRKRTGFPIAGATAEMKANLRKQIVAQLEKIAVDGKVEVPAAPQGPVVLDGGVQAFGPDGQPLPADLTKKLTDALKSGKTPADLAEFTEALRKEMEAALTAASQDPRVIVIGGPMGPNGAVPAMPSDMEKFQKEMLEKLKELHANGPQSPWGAFMGAPSPAPAAADKEEESKIESSSLETLDARLARIEKLLEELRREAARAREAARK